MAHRNPKESPVEEQDDDISDMPSVDLFWKGVVKAEEPLIVSRVENYFLRITNACLGPDAKKNTRTSLQVVQPSDEESEEPGVVCTLKNGAENHTLDLLVSDDIQLSVAGENPSNIYLVGFLSPADQYIGDNPLDLENDMDEIEDDEALEEELKNLRSKGLESKPARKRNLAEMEADDDTKKPAAPAAATSAAKKQKTATGAAKPTAPEKKEATKAAPAEQENNQKKQNPNQNQTQPQPQPQPQNQNQQNNSNPKPNPPNANPNQAQNANADANAKKKKKNKKKNKKNQKDEKASEQGPATATKDEVIKEAPAEKAKETPAEKTKETPAEKAKETPTEKAKETKEAGEAKTETKTETKDNKSSGSETWKNGPQGLKFNDIRAGTGKVVKKGSKVKVHYVGQLPDKHVFDKVIEGEGFAFELGAGEVIQGWEKGLLGMKVGGKRRLQIPAKLAYGEEGSKPEIPPNSDLTYTIEIKSVD